MVERLFLAVPWGCLRFVIVVFPDHTHLLFLVPNRIKTLSNNMRGSRKFCQRWSNFDSKFFFSSGGFRGGGGALGASAPPAESMVKIS